jgi:hypothetical protein
VLSCQDAEVRRIISCAMQVGKSRVPIVRCTRADVACLKGETVGNKSRKMRLRP